MEEEKVAASDSGCGWLTKMVLRPDRILFEFGISFWDGLHSIQCDERKFVSQSGLEVFYVQKDRERSLSRVMKNIH